MEITRQQWGTRYLFYACPQLTSRHLACGLSCLHGEWTAAPLCNFLASWGLFCALLVQYPCPPDPSWSCTATRVFSIPRELFVAASRYCSSLALDSVELHGFSNWHGLWRKSVSIDDFHSLSAESQRSSILIRQEFLRIGMRKHWNQQGHIPVESSTLRGAEVARYPPRNAAARFDRADRISRLVNATSSALCGFNF